MANLPDQGDPSDAAFVRITNRQIYDSLIHLERVVDSMDGRMNAILNENVDMKKRVRALELKVYAVLAGMTSVISAAGLMLFTRILGG